MIDEVISAQSCREISGNIRVRFVGFFPRYNFTTGYSKQEPVVEVVIPNARYHVKVCAFGPEGKTPDFWKLQGWRNICPKREKKMREFSHSSMWLFVYRDKTARQVYRHAK